MNRVEDKVVIVTGGALGIGRSACVLLPARVLNVAVTDVLDEPGLALVQEIESAGGRDSFWHLDVASEAAVAAVFRPVHGQFGGIDVLVNNAGITGVNKPTHEVTEEEWDRLMAVNVKGVFFCMNHAIPYKDARGRPHHQPVVDLRSHRRGGPSSVPASKGAARLMSKNDALLYAADRIRVNSIHRGFIYASHPYGHVGEPDDIGWGVVYLASDQSKFVTGSELVIDGGYTAR